MSLRFFLTAFSLFFLAWNSLIAQRIADFNFESNETLTTNDVPGGEDAFYINPNAHSKEGGVYVQHDPSLPSEERDIDLRIPEEMFKDCKSLYLEFDYQNEDEFGWLIFSGEIYNIGIGHLENKGFRVRYYTKQNTEKVIDSWDPDYTSESAVFAPLARGERAVITFIYDHEEGIAYLLKDDEEIWRTPEEQRTPGSGFHCFTQNGYFSVGSHMGEEESQEPHLYYFRAFEEACADDFKDEDLILKNDTICGPGFATLKVSGGQNVQYYWYESMDATEPLAISDTFTTPPINETTAFYVQQVKGPCQGDRLEVLAVVDPLPPAPQVAAEKATRCGAGKVTLSASGGGEGAFRWYKGNSSSPIPGATSSTYETGHLESSGLYYVSVVEKESGCESEKTAIEAVIHAKPEVPQIQSHPLSQCGPGKVEVQLFKPEAPFSATGFRLYQKPDDTTPLLEGNGSLLELEVKADTLVYVSLKNEHCESEKVPLSILVQALPEVEVGDDVTLLKGESIQLKAEGNFTAIRWEPALSMDFPTDSNPTVSPTLTTTYKVTAINENGCENTDTIRVFVVNKYPTPNAFSPNNDGVNDFWKIPNAQKYPNSKLLIFNRWGSQVYASEGILKPWNGTFNGQELPMGTYYFTLQLSPKHELIKGSIFLMR